MDVRSWNVVVVEANKFEGQLILDMLRNAGVDKVKVFTDSEAAMDALEVTNANIVILSLEATPVEGVTWTKAFRRNHRVLNRKAAVFVTSRAFSRSIAEDCRHGGANALIGKPLSPKVLLATINKVLSSPREFIDAAGYVGPCRRAGIVTAGAPKKRRQADEAAAAQEEADTLAQAFAQLTAALTQMSLGQGGGAQCDSALRRVQAYAVNANDRALMSVCGTLAQQLTAHDLRSEAGKAVLKVCAHGISQLAELGLGAHEQRNQVAAGVQGAIAKVVAAAKAA